MSKRKCNGRFNEIERKLNLILKHFDIMDRRIDNSALYEVEYGDFILFSGNGEGLNIYLDSVECALPAEKLRIRKIGYFAK